MKTKILAVILAVAMLVSMLPMSSAVSAATKFSSTEFDYATQADFDAVWETVEGNYKTSTTPKASTAPQITTTDDGKTVISAALSTTRASMMTTLKSDYFRTDARIESITAKMKADTLATGSLTNADGAPGIYAMHLNTYKSAVLQLGEYYKSGDANNGFVTLQWSMFYDDAGATENGCSYKILDADNKNTRSVTSLVADDWITITITYDYSNISDNSLKLTALLTDESGNSHTAACRITFDASGNNAYSEGFKVGLASTSSAKLPAYYDYFAITYEKTAADEANEFKTKYADVLAIEEIGTSGEFETVEAAIAEYETLSEEVKALLTEEIAKLNSLMNDFDATCFIEENATVLDLETVSTNAQASAVVAAINAYAELDDAVKALLTEQITKLNELKATIKITEFDFEDEVLFAETWETLPSASDSYIYYGKADGTEQAGNGTFSVTTDAELVAETDNDENKVLYPVITNWNRKRKITTPKTSYLNSGDINSFSTDIYFAAQATFDNNAGPYLLYVNEYNWLRLEVQTSANNEKARVQGIYGSDASSITVVNANQKAIAESPTYYNKWLTVKTEYVYAEDSLTVNVTIREKATSTVLSTLTCKLSEAEGVTNQLLANPVKVGYGAGYGSNHTYFDNFALTYASEEPEVTPEDLAAEFNTKYEAVLAKDAIGDDDVATVDAAIAEYATLDEEVQTLLADSITKLNTLKADYLAAREAAEFNSTYGEALDLEAITSDIEYDAVDAALGAYILLDDSVKAIINLDVSKYEDMMNAYNAEKANKAAAAEYESVYAVTFEITVITNDTELEAVDAAVTAYKALDPAVQAFVTVDIAKYEGLIADYNIAKANEAAAAEYKTTHADALALETINSQEEYDKVVAAITAYNELGDGAKALLADDTLTKLEALKADYDEYLTADYTPVIKGATIRRSGTQTLAFRCAVGDVNARKQVVDCGIIVTASSYITDGYVNSEDLVVDSTNDLVIVAPLDDVSNITSGYEFTVNIGNISSRNYGVRYIAKVFVKYSDGTIEYSETATKSVISVAKAIATWTFWNQKDYNICATYGIEDIATIISDIDENGNISYAYDVTTDNGVKILEYLEANNEAIAVAYNALKNAQ